MVKLDIYNQPQEPLEEYEYPLEKITKSWTKELSGILSEASKSCKNAFKSGLQGISEIPTPEIPIFIKNIPRDLKEIHAQDEPMVPNMLYVLASGTGTGIMLKKSKSYYIILGGLFSRFTMPVSAMVLTFYFLYPKTSNNLIEKYIKKFR
jgi:hypothetical protein